MTEGVFLISDSLWGSILSFREGEVGFFYVANLMDSDRCILLIENAHGHDRTHPSERPSRV